MKIPERKLKLLADRVYEQCDAKDGLKDGLIDDLRRCGFSPSRDLPKREADVDADSCFTATVEALDKVHADVRYQHEGETISYAFAQSFFQYLAVSRERHLSRAAVRS